MFQDELPNIVEMFADFKDHSREQMATAALDETQLSDNFDTIEHSPRAQVRVVLTSSGCGFRFNFLSCHFRLQMLQRIRKVQYTGDPSTLPACSNEVASLVRLQYRLAHSLNQKVSLPPSSRIKPGLIGFFLSLP